MITQREIAMNFPKVHNGLYFSEGLLNESLKRFQLKSKFKNPFMDLIFKDTFREDIFIFGGDLIIAYDQDSESHVSVCENYDPIRDRIKLLDVDNDININSLLRKLHPDLSKKYGFYFLS